MRRNKEKRFENDERETRMYGIHIIFLSTSSGILYSYVREHAWRSWLYYFHDHHILCIVIPCWVPIISCAPTYIEITKCALANDMIINRMACQSDRKDTIGNAWTMREPTATKDWSKRIDMMGTVSRNLGGKTPGQRFWRESSWSGSRAT
jgi:hypothetical protein